jgi:hypothetical protein
MKRQSCRTHEGCVGSFRILGIKRVNGNVLILEEETCSNQTTPGPCDNCQDHVSKPFADFQHSRLCAACAVAANKNNQIINERQRRIANAYLRSLMNKKKKYIVTIFL